MQTFKVTIGASPVNISTTRLMCAQFFFVNNSGHTMYVAHNASSANSSSGVPVITGATFNMGPFSIARINLNGYWLGGTNADAVIVIYETL